MLAAALLLLATPATPAPTPSTAPAHVVTADRAALTLAGACTTLLWAREAMTAVAAGDEGGQRMARGPLPVGALGRAVRAAVVDE